MVNKFLYVGDLSEIRIDLFKTHMKIRLSIAVTPTNVITCQQTISRRYGSAQIQAWLDLAPHLRPRMDSYVYANNQRYFTMNLSTTPTRLLVSGNVNEYKKTLYFNMQYCRRIDNTSKAGLSIEIDGQWVDKDRFVNLTGEWARLFHIPAIDGYEKRLYRLRLEYSSGAVVDGDIVKVEPYGLSIIDCQPLDEYIDDEQMKNILLEIEITS